MEGQKFYDKCCLGHFISVVYSTVKTFVFNYPKQKIWIHGRHMDFHRCMFLLYLKTR